MPERSGPVIEASVDAFLRGVEFSGDGTIELVGEALGLTVGKRRALVAFARLDGLREAAGVLELYADTGDVITLRAEAGLDHLAQMIRTSTHSLPEVTRSLRGLGSHRARPDDDHDRFFAPFIAARARAERTADSEVRLEAFHPVRLREEIERQLAEFARFRYPNQPPDRRATEAILGECTEELIRRLARLDEAAAAVRESSDEVQLARWRAWRDAVREVIAAADSCWFAMRPVLGAASPPPKRRWWQLRAGGRGA
jgi:hypothetical protein